MYQKPDFLVISVRVSDIFSDDDKIPGVDVETEEVPEREPAVTLPPAFKNAPPGWAPVSCG